MDGSAARCGRLAKRRTLASRSGARGADRSDNPDYQRAILRHFQNRIAVLTGVRPGDLAADLSGANMRPSPGLPIGTERVAAAPAGCASGGAALGPGDGVARICNGELFRT